MTRSTGRIPGIHEVREGFQEDKKYRKDFRNTRSTGRISGRQEVREGFQVDKKYRKNWRKTGILQNKRH
jgi:hypothetical protein